MTSRILTVLGLIALTAGLAEARPKFSAQVLYTASGTGEIDPDSGPTLEEDVESGLGFMGTVEWQLNPKSPFRIGLKLGYTSAELDDNGGDASAFDGGVWARYILVPGRFVAYLAGGVGFASMTHNPDGAGPDGEGTGLAVMVGAGASFPVAKGMRLTGGIYLNRHQGELEYETGGVKVTGEAVLQQIQVAFGVAF